MIDIGEPAAGYKDLCGCVWKNGKRTIVCAKHRHKDGIEPHRPSAKDIYYRR